MRHHEGGPKTNMVKEYLVRVGDAAILHGITGVILSIENKASKGGRQTQQCKDGPLDPEGSLGTVQVPGQKYILLW